MLDDADDMAIVQGVVGLSLAFKRRVIAEGVESVEHGLSLIRLGCDLGQGYGIARPMPAEDVQAWVQAYKPDPSWFNVIPDNK
jgi:EAL domain-containing protein (putative c-di-GMP-specific phosphodiesterase class I)